MIRYYPGSKVETPALREGGSRQLFDGIFVTGGITLSQLCTLSGLETHMVQNWVKRGFMSPPVKRLYSRQQLARVFIINMLRETMQIDRICGLIHVIRGEEADPTDDLIGDEELYHCYVDMLAGGMDTIAPKQVEELANKAAMKLHERIPGTRDTLGGLLQVMYFAHMAAKLRDKAEQRLRLLE